MPSPDDLTDAELEAVRRWLARVMHDLVKYLEMMPRSLDWDAFEEDDLEIIAEAVFETRATRKGAQSALEVFEDTLEELPQGLAERLAIVVETRSALVALESLAGEIEDKALEEVDLTLLSGTLFGVGTRLRAARDGLATNATL